MIFCGCCECFLVPFTASMLLVGWQEEQTTSILTSTTYPWRYRKKIEWKSANWGSTVRRVLWWQWWW